jgi:spore maturation protein A
MNPAEIVGTTLFATVISTGAAIVVDRWYRRVHARKTPSGPPSQPPPSFTPPEKG